MSSGDIQLSWGILTLINNAPRLVSWQFWPVTAQYLLWCQAQFPLPVPQPARQSSSCLPDLQTSAFLPITAVLGAVSVFSTVSAGKSRDPDLNWEQPGLPPFITALPNEFLILAQKCIWGSEMSTRAWRDQLLTVSRLRCFRDSRVLESTHLLFNTFVSSVQCKSVQCLFNSPFFMMT